MGYQCPDNERLRVVSFEGPSHLAERTGLNELLEAFIHFSGLLCAVKAVDVAGGYNAETVS